MRAYNIPVGRICTNTPYRRHPSLLTYPPRLSALSSPKTATGREERRGGRGACHTRPCDVCLSSSSSLLMIYARGTWSESTVNYSDYCVTRDVVMVTGTHPHRIVYNTRASGRHNWRRRRAVFLSRDGAVAVHRGRIV